jgi:Flp pilus assembly protein TadG
MNRDLRRPCAPEHGVRPECDEAGSAIIELALVTPLLLVLVLGAFDFGRVFYVAMSTTSAAHAGAQYGAQSTASTSDSAGMVQAAVNSAPGMDIAATAAQVCRCATEEAVVACSTTTPSCLPLRIYASVTTTKSFTTVVDYPGIPHSVTISRTAEIRAQ